MDVLKKPDWLGGKASSALCTLFAFIFLCLMPNMAYAQTTTQYTINQGSGGGNDITAATTCGTGGDPFAPMIQNFVVGTSFTVSDVDLGFFASHAYREDIRLVLESPAGTRVQIVNGSTGGAGNTNFNGLLDDDDLAQPIVNSGGHNSDLLTPVPNPPSQAYEEDLRPNNAFSAFDGENSLGTWHLEICDMFPDADDGNFRRADLFLTDTPPNADLSLTKTVSNATPTSGSTVDYTLTVTSSASSTATANSVTVQDTLPLGTTFNSVVSGTGTYDSGTGVWTVGTIAAGTSASIVIRVDVGATPGAVVTNNAEISNSSVLDMDSTPNNGSTTEDDDASVAFTVAGARVAGTPPSLTTICTVGNQRTHLWSGSTWAATSLINNYTVTDVGSVNFTVTPPPGGLINSTPLINTANSGGFAAGTQALYFYMNNGNNTHSSNILLTLPTAVPGLQFRLFDIDYAAGQFTDKITVTGTFNGSTVLPVLTNGVANYVTGNVAIGDGASGATDPFGNVVVTFLTPVDSVSITYGNHIPTTPTSSGNQAMSLHDFTFCLPTATLNVTKISSILSDGISGSNPKAIPGATVRYCITVSNAGSATATAVSASDNLPADVTFVTGSMRSGTSCGAAASVEDEDTAGADESDPFGMSFAAGGTNGTGVVTGTAGSLAPSGNMAMVFNVTLD